MSLTNPSRPIAGINNQSIVSALNTKNTNLTTRMLLVCTIIILDKKLLNPSWA